MTNEGGSQVGGPRTVGGAERAGARRWADLLPRVLSGLVMVTLAVGATIAGGRVFALFWLLAAGAIVWEWQRLIGPEGARARCAAGFFALGAAVPLATSGRPGLGLLAIAIGAGVAALLGAGRRLMAALGIVYAGVPVLTTIWLRESFPLGGVAIAWLFAVVWGTDVMAYFGGRLIGGPKLSPRFSPKKTWSGFLIGVAAGALAGLTVAPSGTSHLIVLLIGLAAAVLAQAGDIAESALKRRYGVKDASNLIPGHGGVMDRLDGFVVASVFACAVGALHTGLDAAAFGLLNWP